MFQIKYFLLFVLLGFAVGFSNTKTEVVYDDRGVESLSPLFNIISVGALIWSFGTFGFSWGVLSCGEMLLGFIAGAYARRQTHELPMFFNSPKKVGRELAELFRQATVPAFLSTKAMEQANNVGRFKYPSGFFQNDYFLGFLVGSLQTYILGSSAARWSNERKAQVIYQACFFVSGDKRLALEFAERRLNVLMHEKHPLNDGYNDAGTLAGFVQGILPHSEYENNSLLISAIEQAEKHQENIGNRQDAVTLFLFMETFKKQVESSWEDKPADFSQLRIQPGIPLAFSRDIYDFVADCVRSQISQTDDLLDDQVLGYILGVFADALSSRKFNISSQSLAEPIIGPLQARRDAGEDVPENEFELAVSKLEQAAEPIHQELMHKIYGYVDDSRRVRVNTIINDMSKRDDPISKAFIYGQTEFMTWEKDYDAGYRDGKVPFSLRKYLEGEGWPGI